jgi:GntR family transcriptional regulator
MSINMSEFSLNKNTPVPYYFQLKQFILSKILSGEIVVGECLPTEIEIADALDISRSTIRQAIMELVNEGYLHREKAKGTFVSRPKIDESFFSKLDSFNSEMLKKGLQPSTKVLVLKVVSPVENINKSLKIGDDERLIHLARLRYANDEPVVYLETYFSYQKYKGLMNEDFANKSLYFLFEDKYFQRVTKAVRIIEAVNATGQEARLLDIKVNAAICLVKTTAFTSDNVPVEYSIARYRGDRNQFTVELGRT